MYEDRKVAQFDASFFAAETYFPGGPTAASTNDFLAGLGSCALLAGCRLFGHA